MEKHCDIAIIGGGAVGLFAAVSILNTAAKPLSVCLFERGKRVGRKLVATGNGTCNITNQTARKENYHGADPAFAEALLQRFSPADTEAFFAKLGVLCVAKESGKVYPLCEQAVAVLDALRLEAAANGVAEYCETEVQAIKPCKEAFSVVTQAGTVRAKRVLVCTGGAASPSLGGYNGAYRLLTDLGHTRTPLFPSIVQVRTDTTYIKAVKGIRVQATISFHHNGPIATETGEVLFTEYGLSGPAVMQISRCVADWERRQKGTMTAVLDLLPNWDKEALLRYLEERAKLLKDRTLEDFFTGFLNKRVGQTLLRAANITPLSRKVGSLTSQDICRLTDAVKAWQIPVTGTQGFGGAQVTAGGIATAEFHNDTLESRLVSGLYAAGEVLDIDGDCGGYNLQFAWSSAHAAATAIVRSLEGGPSRDPH